jgi:flagellar biosynthesis protein FlhF
MNIKRFFGKNSREALSMVRHALGENAIILSNRQVNGGNEIMAFKEEDMREMRQQATDGMPDFDENFESRLEARLEARLESRDEPVPLLSMLKRNNRAAQEAIEQKIAAEAAANKASAQNNLGATNNWGSSERASEPQQYSRNAEPQNLAHRTTEHNNFEAEPKREQRVVMESVMQAHPANNNMAGQNMHHPHMVQGAPIATMNQTLITPNTQETMPSHLAANLAHAIPQAAPAPVFPMQQMEDMLTEMRTMRSAIESQLTTLSWGNIQQREPAKAAVLSSLLAAGFSASLSRYLAENVPSSLNNERAMMWVRSILAKNLNTAPSEAAILDQGGVFALIGPTGVGKTTTTAKLAARFVMKHGTNKLGLITTDAYRIGGHEQLRIYGKILGVMVHAVKDEADLQIALQELKNKHTILIDTVGVSQRDRMVAEQIAMLSNSKTPIKKLLCLNATSTGETLTDVTQAYRGKGLDGCIITKVDEAATIGNALDVIIREKLRLFYIANGQRVPEDIHLADKHKLIEHALKLGKKKNATFQYLNEELPLVMGNTVNTYQSMSNSPISGEMNHA